MLHFGATLVEANELHYPPIEGVLTMGKTKNPYFDNKFLNAQKELLLEHKQKTMNKRDVGSAKKTNKTLAKSLGNFFSPENYP